MRIKQLIFLMLLFPVVFTVRAQVRFTSQPTDAVHQMAVQSGKLVFIDLYAPWCASCRQMEVGVFGQQAVGDFMNEWFVCARYDTDKFTGNALLSRYGYGRIPLYLVFDHDGNLLARIAGASSTDDFIADMQRVLQAFFKRAGIR